MYPKLRQYYKLKGFDLEVIDLLWGTSDLALDDHGESLLTEEALKACRKNSKGISFVVCLMNDNNINNTNNKSIRRVQTSATGAQFLDFQNLSLALIFPPLFHIFAESNPDHSQFIFHGFRQ